MQPQASAPLAAGPQTGSPGFGEYLSIIRKRRRLLLGIFLPIAALGGLLAVVLPDVYRSSGHIEIEGAHDTRVFTSRDPEEMPYADQYVQSLSTVVLSKKNLARLLEEHQLYDGQAADPAGAVERLGSDIDVDIVTVPILDPETGREREVVTAFTVAYDNHDPRRAYAGAQWLVEAFLAENRRDRQSQAANTAKFFGKEAERLRARVADLEAELAAFKAKNAGRLPELTEMNMNVMDRTESDIKNVEMQMQALRRERVFLLAQLQQAQSTGPETASLRQLEDEYSRMSATYDESHPDLVSLRRRIDTLRAGGSTTGMSLRQQLQTQRSVLSEARQRYSEDHPDVKRIMRNIQSLEARIASGETADQSLATHSPMAVQLQTQLNATDLQIAALTARGAELRAKMSELEGRMSAAPEVEREFQIVTRDLASARAKYEELLQRQMDAEVREAAIAGGAADKFHVKSVPMAPSEPAKPQRIAILIMAMVLGAIAAVTAVVMAQLLDQTVRGVRDVREILDVTPLSAVPVIRRARGRRARRKGGFASPGRAAVALALIALAAAYFIS